MGRDNAIVIGGQSINLWAEFYRSQIPDLLEQGPFLSRDIDFLHNARAETSLVKALGGKLVLPSGGDHTPNAALFLGEIEGCRVRIDFMREVLGVKADALKRRFVTIAGVTPSGETVSILLMHPLHCFQSRLANINTLGRRDAVAIRQARASVHILRAFLDDLLSRSETRQAQSILREYFFTLKQGYFGFPAHIEIDLHPEVVLDAFRGDSRFDARWRGHQLQHFIETSERLRSRALGPPDL